MKKAAVILIAIFCAGVFLFSAGTKTAKTVKKTAKVENKTKTLPGPVIVYYFHTIFRCASCKKIEQYTKESVETYFEKELKSGKLLFKAVNVEEDGNAHFVEKYKLYTKSVILSLEKNGKEVKSKNLTRVWDFIRSKQKFYDYIQQEVKLFLKEG